MSDQIREQIHEANIRLQKEYGDHTLEPIVQELFGKIVISRKEYNDLQRDSCKLAALEGAGVDNWGGYGDIWDDYESMLKELGIPEKE